MKIKTTHFTSEANERLTVVFVFDDNDAEVKRYTYYNEPKEIKIQPELEQTQLELSQLLKMIYNSGLNNENVIFEEETLKVE